MSEQSTFSEVLRKAIAESGLSLYQIAKNTGVFSESLLRFRQGNQSLRLANADRLAACFGLGLATMPPSSLRKSALTLTDALRAAIEQSGITRYQIAKDTGLNQAVLCRFVHNEKSLNLDSADKLAAYLGLRMTPDPEAVPPTPTPENPARPTLAKQRAKRKAS